MRLTCSAALAAFSILLPAYAEEDIVVTATRSPVAADRLPARLEVIDRDHIEARGLATLSEALGGSAVQAGGSGQQSSLFLRGTSSKHALALFDGVRLNDAAAPNAQYDFGQDLLGGIERIEVLRGPASAIYGSDAVGGVVNILPRRGGATAFEPFLEAAAGSFAGQRALAGAAGGDGGLQYGVSAEWFETEGHDLVPARMSTHTGDRDGSEMGSFTGSVRQEAGAVGLDALVYARRSRTEFDSFSGGPLFDRRADDPDLHNRAELALWRLGADSSRGAWGWRVSAGQVLSERNEYDDGDRLSASEGERSFAELSASYDVGDGELNAGLTVERSRIDTIPQFAEPLSVEEDLAAAYLLGRYDFGEALAVTASLRLDDYENFGAQSTYGLGLTAHFGRLRLFASHATAFKAPSLSERFETSAFNIGNPDLAPEQSASWEVGADLALSDGGRAGASLYRTRIEELIEYDFAASRNVNVGEAEIDGAELFVEAAPATWADIRASYAWTDARNNLSGARLARRPEHAWSIEARLAPTPRFGLTASWTYVGERTDVLYDDDGAFIDADGRVDGFSIGALSATYQLTEQVSVLVRVDNVADETYEQPAAFAAAPRNGWIGLRGRF